jgi:hypothetical protein
MMKMVVAAGAGELELNVMWLPTWLGMNTALHQELEADLTPQIVGRVLDEATLELAHEAVLDFFERKFPNIEGLRDYLDAIKFVVLT